MQRKMRVEHHMWKSLAYLPHDRVCKNPGREKQFVTSLRIHFGANGCVPRTDVAVKSEDKQEGFCGVLQEGETSRGISRIAGRRYIQWRLGSSWMIVDKQWLGQKDSCSRSQESYIKE